MNKDKRKKQHGVQVVWADPVSAGVRLKEGEEYVASWHWFDTKQQAIKFIEHYIYDVGKDPAFGGVKEINQGTRWAVEEYTEPKITLTVNTLCMCQCHIWPDQNKHVVPCCDVAEERKS